MNKETDGVDQQARLANELENLNLEDRSRHPTAKFAYDLLNSDVVKNVQNNKVVIDGLCLALLTYVSVTLVDQPAQNAVKAYVIELLGSTARRVASIDLADLASYIKDLEASDG